MNFVLRVTEKHRNSKRVCPSHAQVRQFRKGVDDGSITALEIQITKTKEVLHVIPVRFLHHIGPAWNTQNRPLSYETWDVSFALKAMAKEAIELKETLEMASSKPPQFIKKNFVFNTVVRVVNTASPLDGIVGRITGKSFIYILDSYIVTLDDPVDLGTGVFQSFAMTESCLESA